MCCTVWQLLLFWPMLESLTLLYFLPIAPLNRQLLLLLLLLCGHGMCAAYKSYAAMNCVSRRLRGCGCCWGVDRTVDEVSHLCHLSNSPFVPALFLSCQSLLLLLLPVRVLTSFAVTFCWSSLFTFLFALAIFTSPRSALHIATYLVLNCKRERDREKVSEGEGKS